MNGETSAARIDGATIARLARGVRLRDDAVRGQQVLLAPERAMALDEIAVRIVHALDGARSIDAITDAFAAEFGAPRDQIAGDVIAFVQELSDRRMLEILS
jgi:pyrroloquinoline quinone biosynthesis protein D